ncbi:recombinase family protein [Lentzea sp. NEAU-D7]|uniref:recombinase family protein n=1 Tax=Lentzea sp. NEAU-D7 TaxID=2994667 RepID=UPI00224B4DA7|nr:recombinase family protein [Lentzea sp. NEAU-D7]MCX2950201.1 recombinase family protein [Lentzea sp. NEAU-D7]
MLDGIGPVALYGRCSTEDNQDPKTSRGWQFGNATKFVEPFGAEVVAEFFDIGQSRSVPWDRRHEASRLLAELKNPRRGWHAVVVGEGTRCWFGNQFSLIAPRFEAYGVDLWVPELGGKYDPRNPSHKMLMSVLGGMSESERQHVQARVRAAMDAQVVNEGRHQGGRAPYGFVTVDGGPHPNPKKAAEGFRLRVLAVDEFCAAVVRRIFAEYIAGMGDRAIAEGLNRDGIPCPSRQKPEQNKHRLADGWQGSTVRVIVENPKYTGYAFFGRWTRHEVLLDPDDVAAGHVVRFRRAAPDKVVRSRMPAHPQIISVEEFTQAQLIRQGKGAGGLATACKAERSGRPTKRPYLFRGRLRHAECQRKMEGAPRKAMYYRCASRTLVPGSEVAGEHPPSVYLREDVLTEAVNAWIGGLFAPENVDRTVAALLEAQEPEKRSETKHGSARQRLTKAEEELKRFQNAIKAGVDPAALVEGINEAQASRAVAQAELVDVPTARGFEAAEIQAMIDALGDVGAKLADAKPESLADVYKRLDLQVLYTHIGREADVSINLTANVGNAYVRGGT